MLFTAGVRARVLAVDLEAQRLSLCPKPTTLSHAVYRRRARARAGRGLGGAAAVAVPETYHPKPCCLPQASARACWPWTWRRSGYRCAQNLPP